MNRMAGMSSSEVNGIACDANGDRSHGHDERILLKSCCQSLKFNDVLLKDL